MAALVYETPSEKAVSGALALVMHVLFGVLLVFGVTWKKPEPVAMVADLWSNLPPVPAPKVAPPPPPPPKVEPEPPKPAPKVEAKPPRVDPKPQPKAEIDLREKREKALKAEQEKLAEKKKKEEQQRQELLKQQQAKEAAEAKRLAQEQAEAQRKLAQQAAAARAGEIDKYRLAIQERIKRFITEPTKVEGNPVAVLDIIILPGGEVLDVRTRKSSGQVAWDNACERAIRRAQPLPVPPADSPIFREFRELTHACRFKE